MPASPVRDQVHNQVHTLASEVGGQTAQLVALAIVEGAATAFLEIADTGRREAERTLLAATTLDVPAAMAALSN